MNNKSRELYHFGILGQKWGIRRYENKDGTLTAEGKARYGVNSKVEWKSKKHEMRSRSGELRTKAYKKYKVDEKEQIANDASDAHKYNIQRKGYNFDPDDDPDYESVYDYFDRKELKRSYNRQEQTKDDYDNAMKQAEDYVEKTMKKEFGVSYDAWSHESTTKLKVAAGVSAVGGILAFGAVAGATIAAASKADNPSGMSYRDIDRMVRSYKGF